jgi:hypothetical protein
MDQRLLDLASVSQGLFGMEEESSPGSVPDHLEEANLVKIFGFGAWVIGGTDGESNQVPVSDGPAAANRYVTKGGMGLRKFPTVVSRWLLEWMGSQAHEVSLTS